MTFEDYLNQSKTLFDSGQFGNAMDAVQSALKLKPMDANAYSLYIRIALQMDDHDLPKVVNEFKLWFERHYDAAHQAIFARQLSIQQFIDFRPDGSTWHWIPWFSN